MHCIIYLAWNNVNNKKYVGFTSRSLKLRKSAHLSAALTGKSNSAFHSAIRKYGKDAFIWYVIYESDDESQTLAEKEPYYIWMFDTFGDNGYNMTPGGEGCPGREVSDETREKLRIASTGKKASEETKHKMREAAKLKPPRSPETNAKISASNTGKIYGPSKLKGTKRSEETKANMRKPRSTAENMRKPKTAEHKKNLSISKLNNTTIGGLWKITRVCDGTSFTEHSLKKICRRLGLGYNSMQLIGSGKQISPHKGYLCEKVSAYTP